MQGALTALNMHGVPLKHFPFYITLRYNYINYFYYSTTNTTTTPGFCMTDLFVKDTLG